MSNLYKNELRVSGPPEDILKFKYKAVGHIPWGKPSKDNKPSSLNFHSLVPIPEHVLKASYACIGFEWEIANWGCNWGARNVKVVEEREDYLWVHFRTTWAPAIEFIRSVCKQWPTLTFNLDYENPAVGFTGTCHGRGEHFQNHHNEYCS
jgi:hypothetical protein